MTANEADIGGFGSAAQREATVRDECLASGMNGFLSKPYGQNELEEIIVDVLTGFDQATADARIGNRPFATAASEHARLMPAE